MKEKAKDRPIILFHYPNKAMDFIRLPSIILKVSNKFPTFGTDTFQTFKKPIVTYRYDKPVGLKLFNYRQTITNCNVSEFLHTGKIMDCDCSYSPFVDEFHDHVITGDYEIIKNPALRALFVKGPKYRLTKPINMDETITSIKRGLTDYINKLYKRFNIGPEHLITWFDEIIKHAKLNLKLCEKNIDLINNQQRSSVTFPGSAKSELNFLQQKYVIVPVDKASQNYAIICKNLYIKAICEELGLTSKTSIVYKQINIHPNTIIDYITSDIKNLRVPFDTSFNNLPFIYLTPKFHKTSITFRPIIASKNTITKPLSKDLCKVLKLIMTSCYKRSINFKLSTRINNFWIIDNTSQLLDMISNLNKTSNATRVTTYDFTSLYTTLDHDDIRSAFTTLLERIFGIRNSRYITIGGNKAFWANSEKSNQHTFSKQDILDSIHCLINNTYFSFGELVFKQHIGIPMGTDCAPFLANLFLHFCESDFISKNLSINYSNVKLLNCSARYIDDISVFNDHGFFEDNCDLIYPESQILKRVNSNDQEADILDMTVKIVNGKFVTKLFDKRDNFDFKVYNFPHASSNISKNVINGIINSQILRYLNICTHADEFWSNTHILFSNLRDRGHSKRFLKKCFLNNLTKNITTNQKYENYSSTVYHFLQSL